MIAAKLSFSTASRLRAASLSLALLWALLLGSCTDAYLPDVIKSPPSFLVVDGFLNPQGITTIKLSRTYAINSSVAQPPAEIRATLYVEEENGPRYQLREGVAGTYASTATLPLNPAKRYRVRILTQAGKEYASELVAVKLTPDIDQVTWQAENTGLNIYVDAHDATNNTRYYRWDYEETWEIHSPYTPNYEYVNHRIRDIVVPFPAACWSTARSTSVQIEKTTALTQDVVAQHRVRLLPTNTDRLLYGYSILVRQYALTPEEYAYWDLLRKNTESIGTLFDPQPAQLTGNVRCLSDPTDLALGYVGAHSVKERRIFVRYRDLPTSWPLKSGYEACVPPDSVFLDRPNPPPPNPAVILETAFNPLSGSLPIDAIFAPGTGSVIIGYTAKKRDCIDCRLRGTAVKPSFWP